MSNSDQQALLQKYLEGRTSLEEEKTLFAREESHESLDAWVRYVNHRQQSAPDGWNETLWRVSPIRKHRNKVGIKRLVATAASVLLLAVSLLYVVGREDTDGGSTTVTLEEALALIEASQPSTPEQEVYYRDNLVTIYMTYE